MAFRRTKSASLCIFSCLVAFTFLLVVRLVLKSGKDDGPHRYNAVYGTQHPPGLPGFGAARSASRCISPFPKFNDTYVKGACGTTHLAESMKLRAAAYLAHAAMADTEYGDMALVGAPKEPYAALLLRVVRDFDACGRRIWAHPDELEGPHGGGGDDAYRLRVLPGPCNSTIGKKTAPHVAFLIVSSSDFDTTICALSGFRTRMRPGGYVFVDGYHSSIEVKRAVDAFRTVHGMWEPMNVVEEHNCEPVSGSWWQTRYVS